MEDLQALFVSEANELLVELELGLLELEKDASNEEGMDHVFRCLHTLKGNAGMFGMDRIGTLFHHLESIYDRLRNQTMSLSPEILRVTFDSLDYLKVALENPDSESDKDQQSYNEILARITAIAGPDAEALTEEDSSEKGGVYYVSFIPAEEILLNGTNTLYPVDDLVSMGKGIVLPWFTKAPSLTEEDAVYSRTGFEAVIESEHTERQLREVFIFVEAECELQIKKLEHLQKGLSPSHFDQLSAAHSLESAIGFETVKQLLQDEKETKEPAPEKSAKKTVAKPARSSDAGVRVASERLDELMNLVSELVTTQARLTTFCEGRDIDELATIGENVEKITRRLRDNALSMSLVPVNSMVVRFQRLVRDLSVELNKQVVFDTDGAETEIDKSIIEKLYDPMLHLLRNALDHGIESPEERKKNGKPEQGTILLKAYYSGTNVIIEISDDGRGIDIERVRNKVIEKGLLTAKEATNNRKVIDCIFAPGFSTSEKVTGVSGRGVGMDVVRRNISDVRGDIEVDTTQGVGTTFRVMLPLTLSIIDGLLVRIGTTDFVLPLSSVDKCYEVETQNLKEGYNHWITLEGERIPFIELRNAFAIRGNEPDLSQVIKVNHADTQIGLVVDDIIGEYQAVLKPLSRFYHQQDEFSGATILGDGTVALMIDPYRLVKKISTEQSRDFSNAQASIQAPILAEQLT